MAIKKFKVHPKLLERRDGPHNYHSNIADINLVCPGQSRKMTTLTTGCPGSGGRSLYSYLSLLGEKVFILRASLTLEFKHCESNYLGAKPRSTKFLFFTKENSPR